MTDRVAGAGSPTRRLGRILLGAGPPLAGGFCVIWLAGLLAVEGLCFFGECGPDLVGWAVPVAVCWLAGSAIWISGVRRRVAARMWAGSGLLALVPPGGWAILEAVAWR